MSNIEQLEHAYVECNSIIAQYKNCKIIEDKAKLILKITNISNISELKIISSLNNIFEAYINPFSEGIQDVISNIEIDIYTLDEIENISFIYQKPIIENIDEIYFEYNKSILGNSENEESDSKKNILILNLEAYIETKTTRYLTLSEIKEISVSKLLIENEIHSKILFYVAANKKEGMTFYENPFSYQIINEYENDTKMLVINILALDLKRNFYMDLLKSLSDKNDLNGFLIRGEKSINLMINKDFTVDGIAYLEKILDFLVTEKKYTEKFLITKKVLSLYLNDNDDINKFDEKLNKIWKTISHYYNHYIEDDIKDFFKTKDQLLKEAMNVSKVVYEQTDKINTTIFASLFSVLVLVATTFIRSMSNLTDGFIYSMAAILFVFSVIFYHLISSSSKKRYELSENQFNYFLDEVTILQQNEITKIKDTYLEKPYIVLKCTLIKLLIFLIVANLISIGFLIWYSFY